LSHSHSGNRGLVASLKVEGEEEEEEEEDRKKK
jgi:hypothetical protein